MLNRISRQTYGLACLAIFVAIALAGCPAAPGSTKPTVSMELADIASLAVGDTRTVDIRSTFKGDKLTFTVRSSNLGIAAATIAGNNQSVAVLAIGPGTARITVTATNSGGSASQAFQVTVPEPPPIAPTTPTIPTPTTPEEPEVDADYTIKLDGSVKHTLPTGHILQAPASGGVKVERSADGETDNVWIIIAKKKGSHKVSVLSEGKSVGAITVEVPNSRPVRQDVAQDGTTDLQNLRIAIAAGANTGMPELVSNTIGIDQYFKDADNDTIRYRVENAPTWFLIDTEDGFVKDADTATNGLELKYEILQKVTARIDSTPEFTVTLYGSDGEDESARPVVIEFDVADTVTISPRTIGYSVSQDATTGDFADANKDNAPKNRLDLGPRRGVIHTATFVGNGFVFANNEVEKLVNDGLLPSTFSIGDVAGGDIFYQAPGAPIRKSDDGAVASLPADGATPAQKKAEGVDFFFIRSNSVVAVDRNQGGDGLSVGATTRVPFSLRDSGSSGGIIIEYHVWVLTRRQKTTDTGDLDETNDPRGAIPRTKRVFPKTLAIGIVTCSSPPDPIDDCT